MPKKIFKTYPLFTRFSVLSLGLFILIGYFIVLGIAPAVENFIVEEQKLQTVIVINRLANQFLSREDFTVPLSPESLAKMDNFIRNAYIPGALAIFITDSQGRVIYVEPRQFSNLYIGSDLSANNNVKQVMKERAAVAAFTDLKPSERDFLSLSRVFLQAVPITFGTSVELAGVFYSVSRVGFIAQAIRNIQDDFGLRIGAGFLILYIALAFIVANAGRIIRRQQRELKEVSDREVAQAQELARLKDQFVFIAAHELRSPVTAISLSLELLENVKKTLVPQAGELLEGIGRETIRLKSLINDLLDASRLETGKFSINPQPFELMKFLKDAADENAPFAKEHHVVLSLDLAKDLPEKITSDLTKVREVLNNLITNAIKYNRPAGYVKVFVSRDSQRKEILFQVKDTGLGISLEEQKHVFERFWRSETVEVRRLEGTGLGLWISRQIVERLGGRIGFESHFGVGSNFYFALPEIVQALPGEVRI